jgi:hypothetical protein
MGFAQAHNVVQFQVWKHGVIIPKSAIPSGKHCVKSGGFLTLIGKVCYILLV